MTKQEKYWYAQYIESRNYTLSDVYKRWSGAKAHAWKECKNIMMKFGGWGLRIVSSNSFMFVAAFIWEDRSGIFHLHRITPEWEIDFIIE